MEILFKKKELKEMSMEELDEIISENENYREDDMIEYMRLSKKQTGLPMGIFVDSYISFIRNQHGMLVYMVDGDDPRTDPIIPITATENPKIDKSYPKNLIKRIKTSEDDIDKVFNFIKLNIKKIRDYGNGRIDAMDFCDGLIKVNKYRLSKLNKKENEFNDSSYTVLKYLYHATPSFNYESIMKKGLGFSKKDRLYDDDSIYGKERRGVYLSTSPYECEDYVASSDRFYDMCVERGIEDPKIVVFQVRTDGLDYESFHSVDNEGHSYFYCGVIPVTNIKVIS